MPEVSRKLNDTLAKLPDGVKLVAVSKFQPLEKLHEAYEAGQRRFGESRADELAAKAAALPADVEWHFIGHLQTNKVRRVVAHASVIQSIDSERLLRAVSAEAAKAGRTVKVMLQVHVAAEETKSGLLAEEVAPIGRLAATLPCIEVIGVMGMATNTDDTARIDRDFADIAACSRELRKITPTATEISMGMSDDWPAAVSHGATIVRIGSAIFGSR
ncbi:MAG: YggS family pyridoxal phosphate-dependent enzyme [Bacteroides sp.]|nr:YggS family pyridoxal phosphate-dependent enzyme [Bacteroides sp.]MCM1379319.1 YggS family pyridoxal phosphate-dependent enzyme [Bacteroides sp.]MCM1445022.1 YggS family pyridoxal phosphate-dependent enzyme [Prevotella sp.]